jgi:hypothetical protein
MGNTNPKRVVLARLTTNISKEAMRLLQSECERRWETEAGRVPYGKVITEMIVERFGEQSAAIPAIVRRKPA